MKQSEIVKTPFVLARHSYSEPKTIGRCKPLDLNQVYSDRDLSSEENVIMVADTGVLNSDGLGIGNAFSRLGFKVSYHDFLQEEPSHLIEMVRLLKPAFVFVTKGQGMKESTLRTVKRHSTKLVMWYPDAYLPDDKGYQHEFLADILPAFDAVLVNCRGLVGPLTRYNPECHFAPAYFDNHFFKIDGISQQDLNVFGCDAVFVGNNQKVYGKDRLVMLKAIARVCNLKIWGLGWGMRLPRSFVSLAKVGLNRRPSERSLRVKVWKRVLTARPPITITRFSKAVMGRELVDSSLSKAYQCSKVGLNVGALHLHSRKGIDLGFSDRLYECMGNGTPYLTTPIVNIDEWFEEGRDLMTYSSKRDLVNKVLYLLENESVRRDIGRQGRQKVMRDHTIDVRINQYLDIIYGKACPFDCRHSASPL